MTGRTASLASDAALLVGIVAAGFAAQAIGLETQKVAIGFAVVGVGVFLGVGLRKALRR